VVGIAIGASDFPLGQLNDAFALARAAGVTWVRFEMNSVTIHSTKSTFNWTFPDAVVAAAERNGLKPLAVVLNIPRWDTSAPADVVKASQGSGGKTNPNGPCAGPSGGGTGGPTIPSNAYAKYPPLDQAEWLTHVSRVAQRYQGRVRAWEVWNEPDIDGVLTPGAKCPYLTWCGTPHDYARLLAGTATEIRAIDPAASIVLGGMADVPKGNLNFLAQILADSAYPAARYFDIANLHFYGAPAAARERLDRMRATLLAGGAGDRPVWVTETGFPTQGKSSLEAPQVGYLSAIVPAFLDHGVSNLFWFRLKDRPAVINGCPAANAGFGLLREDLSARPVLDVLAQMIVRHPKPSVRGM
jgi:hypothetical protein